MTYLLAEKVTVPDNYIDFAKVFLKKLDVKLLKWSNINKQAIDLSPNKQLLYESIYNLELVKLKFLKLWLFCQFEEVSFS